MWGVGPQEPILLHTRDSSRASSGQASSGDVDGRTVKADCVVVTVPIPVLRDGLLSFSPALPDTKRRAAQSVGAGPAVKLLLRFRERVAPELCHGMTDDGTASPGKLARLKIEKAGFNEILHSPEDHYTVQFG